MIADFIVSFEMPVLHSRLMNIFQGSIGVMERTDMDQFSDVFSLYLKRGSLTDADGMSTSFCFKQCWPDILQTSRSWTSNSRRGPLQIPLERDVRTLDLTASASSKYIYIYIYILF